MNVVELKSVFKEYSGVDELQEEDRRLVEDARQSVMSAYAPYSRFSVGAAVLLENGKVMLGNNQENASYPIGLCAERVAVFAAAANYPGVKMKSIAITALSKRFIIDRPVTPCGACRQAIAEYEHRYKNPIRIIMVGESGKVLISDGVTNFLPWQFTGDDLKTK